MKIKKLALIAAPLAVLILSGCSTPVNYARECDMALYHARIYSGAIADIKELGLEPTRRLKLKENDALYGIVKYCGLKGQYLKTMNYHIAQSNNGLER